MASPCGGEGPFEIYCKPERSGLGNWGYTDSSITTLGGSNDPRYARGMFSRSGVPRRVSSVIDGTTNTILIGESLARENDFVRNAANAARGWTSWVNGGVVCASTIIPINWKSDLDPGVWLCGTPDQNRFTGNWAVSWGFKSYHPGGANFVFADGSVRFLPQNIDHKTFQLLGCPDDGQVVTLP